MSSLVGLIQIELDVVTFGRLCRQNLLLILLLLFAILALANILLFLDHLVDIVEDDLRVAYTCTIAIIIIIVVC